MIFIEQALEVVASRAAAVVGSDFMAAEDVDLASSMGRILGEDIHAPEDFPPFDRSIRDGYALRAADAAHTPVELKPVGESRAGSSFQGVVGPSQCVEIMTGAEVPRGADAVAMVEHTERVPEGRVRILKTAALGQNLQRAASECRRGDRVLESGREIQAAEIAVLAAFGRRRVPVSRKPRVAIIATGDELVEVGQEPGPAEIRNSNSFTLYAQVLEAGGDAEILGIARDTEADLAGKLGGALGSDIVITSGGVSMGKYDLVEGVLAAHGVEIGFNRVAMKPGKPTVFGWRGRTFVFGLPGNPVSTIVSFQLFVRPLIRRLLHAKDPDGGLLDATLEAPVRCDPVRAACVPARVHFDRGGYRLSPVEWKGSSDLVGLARANAYVLVPRQEGVLEAGSAVRFIPMARAAPA